MLVGRIWPSSGRARPAGAEAAPQAARRACGRTVTPGRRLPRLRRAGTERSGAAGSRRGRQAHLGRLGFEFGAGIGGGDAGKASEALVHGGGAPHARPWLHLRASVADENDGLGHLEEKRRAL